MQPSITISKHVNTNTRNSVYTTWIYPLQHYLATTHCDIRRKTTFSCSPPLIRNSKQNLVAQEIAIQLSLIIKFIIKSQIKIHIIPVSQANKIHNLLINTPKKKKELQTTIIPTINNKIEFAPKKTNTMKLHYKYHELILKTKKPKIYQQKTTPLFHFDIQGLKPQIHQSTPITRI